MKDETKVIIHIYKDEILGIDTVVKIDGAYIKCVSPINSVMGDIYPGREYVFKIADYDLYIELKKR